MIKVLASTPVLSESIKEYLSRLGDLNIQRLGQGAFGTAFQHPTLPNVVVKVYEKDGRYENFLAWAEKNQSNKYVPRIYARHDLKDGKRQRVCLVFLEKLKKCTSRDYTSFVRKVLAPLVDPDGKHELKDNKFRSLEWFSSDDWATVGMKTTDQELSKVAKYLSKIPNHRLDLNSGNVMKRGDQLVITDPAS